MMVRFKAQFADIASYNIYALSSGLILFLNSSGHHRRAQKSVRAYRLAPHSVSTLLLLQDRSILEIHAVLECLPSVWVRDVGRQERIGKKKAVGEV